MNVCAGIPSFKMHLLVLCSMATYAVFIRYDLFWEQMGLSAVGAYIGPDPTHKSECFPPLIFLCSMKIESWIMNEWMKKWYEVCFVKPTMSGSWWHYRISMDWTVTIHQKLHLSIQTMLIWLKKQKKASKHDNFICFLAGPYISGTQ